MAYPRFHRHASNHTPRTITVKYPGPCACCGATIKAGERAIYYPAGTFRAAPAIAHIAQCTDVAPLTAIDPAVNDYAGDGLDARYEDQCADICGR